MLKSRGAANLVHHMEQNRKISKQLRNPTNIKKLKKITVLESMKATYEYQHMARICRIV